MNTSSLIPLLFFSLVVFSCNSNKKKEEQKSETSNSKKETNQQKDFSKIQIDINASSSESDTLTIEKKSAVLYQPDSLQIEKRMNQVGEEDFRVGMDDYIYYINISAEYLEKQGLPVLNAKNKKYLKFISEDKKITVIQPDSLEELWGIYLFDAKQKPYFANITIIEDDFKNYFKKIN